MTKLRLQMLSVALAGLALTAPAKAQFIPGASPMDMSAQSRALTSSMINRNAPGRRGRDAMPSSADNRPVGAGCGNYAEGLERQAAIAALALSALGPFLRSRDL